MDVGLRQPAIRLPDLVTLHQEFLVILAGPPVQHPVDHDVIVRAAAQDYVRYSDPFSFCRLDQEQVAITHQGLHACAVGPEAQGFTALQDVSA
jgi:hypothetical protein